MNLFWAYNYGLVIGRRLAKILVFTNQSMIILDFIIPHATFTSEFMFGISNLSILMIQRLLN